MTSQYRLSRSTKTGKKWQVLTPSGRTIHFGAEGYEDYTIHKDADRMKRYIQRHERKENWTKTGLSTAGFWSRWILWNKPGLKESVRDTERRFNIRIILCRTKKCDS